jgi:uncharacterized membrane protein YeaQ/YmgE (transglycosylase-associated protein family)
MAEQWNPSAPDNLVKVLLGVIGAVVVGLLALTESFQELPAAVAAYVGACWVLRLEHARAGSAGSEETR